MSSLRALLNFYSFEKDQKLYYLNQLKNVEKKYSHFLFTVSTQKFEIVRYPYKPPDADDESDEESQNVRPRLPDRLRQRNAEKTRDAIAIERAKRFLSVGTAFGSKEASEAALVIFEMLYPFLPKDKINVHNLTIRLRFGSGDGREAIISIVDYIANLCHEGSEPSFNIIRFHDYVKYVKKIHISQCFIANRLFWDYI
jgi:hypothetical protein